MIIKCDHVCIKTVRRVLQMIMESFTESGFPFFTAEQVDYQLISIQVLQTDHMTEIFVKKVKQYLLSLHISLPN